MKKTIIGVALAALALTGCGTYSKTDASSADCVYNGGPFDSKSFRQAVEPGAGRTSVGYFSEVITVPVNVRQYDAGDGLPAVTVSVRGIQETFSPSLTFTLNSEPRGENEKPVVCDFIEKHLKPLGATDFNADLPNNKWVTEFLNARVGPVVRDVAPRVLAGLDPTDLALNSDGVRDAAAKEFGRVLTETLAQQLGGQWFCNPSYPWGGTAEQCGHISVVLPEPTLSDEDRKLIAAPQRARTEADNAIAVAQEDARKAAEIAAQLEIQAESAETSANAREQIAEQNNRVAAADATNTYAWCAELVRLGQDCALVKAAESGQFPSMILEGSASPVVQVPAPAGG